MSKTIKLHNGVYAELEKFRDKRETFSDAIKKLLETRPKVFELITFLEGQLRFREWQRDQEKTRDAQ